MSRDDWERAIARAAVEGSFRAHLLADPADALAEYGLHASEAYVIDRVRTLSLNDFAARVLQITQGSWGADRSGTGYWSSLG
ncbi:MAG: hypothetical protein ACHQ4H_06485 [Ktedonobacterales bacterium]